MRMHYPFQRALLLTFIFLVQFAYMNASKITSKSTYCETAACSATAKRLAKGMDLSRKPCNDIYQYVCNKLMIPQRYTRDIFQLRRMLFDVKNTQHEKLQNILKEQSKAEDSEELTFARKLYQTCLNKTARDTQGLTTLHYLIKAVDGWPLLSSEGSLSNHIEWQDINKKIDRYLTSESLYSLYWSRNTEIPANIGLHLSEPVTFLPYGSDRERKIPNRLKVDSYRQFIENVAEALAESMSVEVDKEKLKKDIDDIIEFEKDILKIIGTRISSNTDFKLIPIKEIQTMYDEVGDTGKGKIDWLDIMRNKYFESNANIDPSTNVTIIGWSYFHRLGPLLHDTTTRTIVNYIVWHFIRSLLPYTTGKMENYVRQAEKVVLGEEKKPEEICLEMPNLVYAVDYEYAKRYFPEERKQKVLQILRDINSAILQNIKRAKWTVCPNRSAFRKAVNSVVPQVGYPDWYSEKGMHEYYEKLDKSMTTLLDGVLKVKKFTMVQEGRRYGQFYDPTDWVFKFYQLRMELDSANGNFSKGSLRIPAGMLDDEIFHPDNPEAINYAAIGYRLAYSMAYGYGSLTKLFRQNENATKAMPVEKQTAYNDKKRCFQTYFQSQIASTPITGLVTMSPSTRAYINESVSIDDFIKDVAVFSSVWKAWLNHRTSINNYEDVRLRGFYRLNSDQLFFISLVSHQCRKIMFSKEHFRMSIGLANLPAFSDVFECPVGSPMNPVEKCSLWL